MLSRAAFLICETMMLTTAVVCLRIFYDKGVPIISNDMLQCASLLGL